MSLISKITISMLIAIGIVLFNWAIGLYPFEYEKSDKKILLVKDLLILILIPTFTIVRQLL